jgi:hypothetical protein
MRLRRTFTALAGAITLGTALPAAAHAGQVGVNVSIQGSGMTAVTAGSIEDGASGVCDRRGNLDERVTLSCPRIRNEEVFQATVWLRAEPGGSPSGHWRFAGWSGCDLTRVTVWGTECGVRSGPFSGDEKSPKAIFADDHAPTVSSIGHSISSSVERRVGYSFSTNEGQLSCRFDASAFFVPCSSGVTRDYATEGTKTIEVRATDASGQVSSTVSHNVIVLDTRLDGGPAAGSTDDGDATFGFSSDAATGYECSLDGGLYTACNGGSKSYAGLPSGTHTFRVRSRNGDWFDHIPVTRTWTVDSTPPATTLSGTPARGSSTTSTSASFAFASPDGSSFQCRLDGGGWAPCTSPHDLTGLSRAPHTFAVRAVDAVGNVDPTPESWSWTVVAGRAPVPQPPPHPKPKPVPKPAPDRLAPAMRLYKAAPQRALKAKAIRFSVKVSEKCTLKATAKLGSKRLGTLRRPLAGGRRATLRIALGRKAQAIVRAALKKRPKATVILTWSCADAAGNVVRSKTPAKLAVKR